MFFNFKFIIFIIKNTTLGTVIVVNGSFFLLLFLVKKYVWKSIINNLDKRKNKIYEKVKYIKECEIYIKKLQKKIEIELLNSKFLCNKIIIKAKEKYKIEIKEKNKKYKEDINNFKKKIYNNIKLEFDKKLYNINQEIIKNVYKIIEKFLNKKLSIKDHKEIIELYIKNIGKYNKND